MRKSRAASSSMSTRNSSSMRSRSCYPADHYVMVDDKVRILTELKKIWGTRVTTVFPRQGHYALAEEVARYPKPDITIDSIAELAEIDLPRLMKAGPAEN